MMKTLRSILFLIILMCFSELFAQPEWTDYERRVQLYPDSEFFTGYMSGVNLKSEDPARLKAAYEQMARDQLVQSILVDVESKATLNVSNRNGKSDEDYSMESISMAKATVPGLIVKSYYDLRKKEVFALAIANKEEIVRYYNSVFRDGIKTLQQHLTEGERFAQAGDKQEALKALFSCKPLMLKMEQAQLLLMAMNRNSLLQFEKEHYNELSLSVSERINQLTNPDQISLDDACYFAAYSLSLQLGEEIKALKLNEIAYENTGLTSDFSDRWSRSFKRALIEDQDYNFPESANNSGVVEISGTYWIKNEMVTVYLLGQLNGEIIAASEGIFKKSWLAASGVDAVPMPVKLLDELSDINIDSLSLPSAVTSGATQLVSVKVKLAGVNGVDNASHLPMILTLADKRKFFRLDEAGEALVFLPELKTRETRVPLILSVDLAEYLGILPDTPYYRIASRNCPVRPVELSLKVNAPVVWISSTEQGDAGKLSSNIIEPAIKSMLADEGYVITDVPGDAELHISIHAKSTASTQQDGISFSYVDAVVSLYDVISEKEVEVIEVSQVKGAGANRTKAVISAYNKASNELISLLQSYLKK